MEILILIIGLSVFFEHNKFERDVIATNVVGENIEKIDNETQAQEKINQPLLKFEIVNKNGVWVFAPINNKKQKTIKISQELSKFITLPDGSKIEKGILR